MNYLFAAFTIIAVLSIIMFLVWLLSVAPDWFQLLFGLLILMGMFFTIIWLVANIIFSV